MPRSPGVEGHRPPAACRGRGDLQGQGVGEASQQTQGGRDDADEDVQEPERDEDGQHHQLPEEVVWKRRSEVTIDGFNCYCKYNFK